MISSRQHPMVKEFRRVARGDRRLALLDGWHLLDDATRSRVRLTAVAVVSVPDVHSAEILDRARHRGADIVEVSRAVAGAISPVRTPSGVVALAERPSTSFNELMHDRPALIVVAVDMQDPGNVGALIRSAEAGGATGVVVAGTSSDPWGWKALRAAMGSTLRLPVVSADDVAAALDLVREAGVRVVATVPRGGAQMYDVDMRSSIAVVIGGEGAGLPPAVLEAADLKASIPMQPPVESLNAAVAAALVVYEAKRQRERK